MNNRLAASSKSPEKAKAAAKAYFVDLNDMTEWAVKKNGNNHNYSSIENDIILFFCKLKSLGSYYG
jgi:hypothetical protein